MKKRPIVSMTREQIAAGQKAWAATEQRGNVASGADFEQNAPKTWIRWVTEKGEERAVIECELYMQPRASGGSGLVGMLHGECPCCRETFLVREDNKEMSIGHITYRQAMDKCPWLRVHWHTHLAKKFGLRDGLTLADCAQRGRLPSAAEMVRPPRDSDKIPVVSGTNRVEEPWTCAYCHRFAVLVYEGIARDYHKNQDRIIITGSRPAPTPVPPTSFEL